MSKEMINSPQQWVVKAFLLFALYTLAFGLVTSFLDLTLQNSTLNLINRSLLLALILGFIYICGGWGLLQLSKRASRHEFWILAPMLILGGLTFISPEIKWQQPNVLSMLMLAIVMALGEEFLFRGYVLSLLEKSGGFRAAVIAAILFGGTNIVGFVSPVVFGDMDYRMVFVQILFFFSIGLIMGAARLTSGSLWMVCLANIIFKFSAFIASGGVAAVWVYSESGVTVIPIISTILGVWGLFCCWFVTRKGTQSELLRDR